MELLGNYLFPIAMCILMFWHMTKKETLHEEEVKKLSEQMEYATKAVNNNTIVIQKLLDKLED